MSLISGSFEARIVGMRLFIAIDIDRKSVKRIAELVEALRRRVRGGRGVKWVEPENIHLTMQFLGEVADDKIMTVLDAFKAGVRGFSDFDLELRGVGSFGNPARVVWVGTRSRRDILGRLQESIANAMEELGFSKDGKEFQGHITVCRIKSPFVGERVRKILKDYPEKQIAKSHVDSVAVYSSELTKDGPVYTCVCREVLGG